MKKITLSLLVVLGLLLSACSVVAGALPQDIGPSAQPTPVIQPTPQPAAPTSAPEPTAVVPTPQPPKVCTVINDYQLQDLPELSVENGGYLHVEWFLPGQPEYETVLPSGRYLIKTPLAGHVWEYSPDCDPNQVLRQVADHIARRLALKANNGGFVPYQRLLETNDLHLLETVVMTGNPDIPLALP